MKRNDIFHICKSTHHTEYDKLNIFYKIDKNLFFYIFDISSWESVFQKIQNMII